MFSRTRRLTLAALGTALLVPALATLRLPLETAAAATGAVRQAPTPPAPVPGRDGARMQPAPGADYALAWQPGGYAAQITALRRQLKLPEGSYTNVRQLMAAADHHAKRQCGEAKNPYPGKNPGALGGGVNPVDWFCLNDEDANAPLWRPQGISGTWDAHAGGSVDDQHVFAFSWHHDNDPNHKTNLNDRSRVSFLDEKPTGADNLYTNVLLLKPVGTGTTVSYENMNTHAGGLIWYNHFLLVADEPTGFLVFDMHNLLDLSKSTVWDSAKSHFGRDQKGRYASYGYRFVLPLVGAWRTNRPDLDPRKCDVGGHQPCYTYAGLDRSGSQSSLLTGEWCSPGQGKSQCHCPTGKEPSCTRGRVARFDMGNDQTCDKGCLVHNSANIARARQVYTQPSVYMQGGISWQGTYYFTQSTGKDLATLFAAVPGRTPLAYAAGIGVQDLYWRRAGERRLWSLTEFKGKGMRVLYGVVPPPAG